MFPTVAAVSLREQFAPTTAYTASLLLFCVACVILVYAIWFAPLCLSRSDAAVPGPLWSSKHAKLLQVGVEGPGEAGSGSVAKSIRSCGNRPPLLGLLAHS